MDEPMNKQTDWTDRQMDRWMNEVMNGQTDRWTDRQMDRWMNEVMNGQTDRWTDG